MRKLFAVLSLMPTLALGQVVGVPRVQGVTGGTALPTSDAHTTAAAPLACRLSDGSAFYSGLTDTQLRATPVPVSGTVTTSPPSNASTNVAQINGVTPLMGNGVTGTGSPRVTIASDNTAFTVNVGTFPDNEPFNLAQVGGTATVTGGVAGSQGVGGLAADAAASAGNPVLVAGKARADGAVTDETAGDAVALSYDLQRRALVRIGHPNPWSCVQSGISAITECKALTASVKHYVTHVVLSNGPTAQTLQVVYGTGSACATGQAALTSTVYLGVNGGAILSFDSSPLAPAAANAICCKPSGATAFSCTLAGHTAP